MHGSAEVWALVCEGNGKSFRFRCHVLPVTLLLLFLSLLSPFLVRVVAAQCPLAFCFDDNLLHSLSLSFSPVLSLNLKLLCLRGQGSDFSVKTTLFQLLTRTQLHSYFAPVLLPFMKEIKMHLHQHYRRTCKKKTCFRATWMGSSASSSSHTQLPTTKPIHSHHPFNDDDDDDDGRGKFVDVLGCWRERERD